MEACFVVLEMNIIFGVFDVFWLCLWHSSKFSLLKVSFGFMHSVHLRSQSICISFINSTPRIFWNRMAMWNQSRYRGLLAVNVQAHDHGPAIGAPSAGQSPSSAPSFRVPCPHWGCKGLNCCQIVIPGWRAQSLSLDDACQRCGCFWTIT